MSVILAITMLKILTILHKFIYFIAATLAGHVPVITLLIGAGKWSEQGDFMTLCVQCGRWIHCSYLHLCICWSEQGDLMTLCVLIGKWVYSTYAGVNKVTSRHCVYNVVSGSIVHMLE